MAVTVSLGSAYVTCSNSGGDGRIVRTAACSNCGGDGYVTATAACPVRGGSGRCALKALSP